jgi:uncharacterized membrane protein YhhN
VLVVVLAVLTGVVTLVDWYATSRPERPAWQQLSRPAPMALLAATVVAADGFDHAAGTWLVVAIVLGGVGDAFLVDPTESRFIGGLTSFLLGHLSYVVAFVALGVDESWWTVGGAAVVIAAFVIARDVLPSAQRRGGVGLAAPVATYMTVIGAMTVTGWSTGCGLIAAGTAIFVCSDTMLAINRFVRELTWSRLPVITTYHVGQFLIAAGVLRMIT